MTRFEYEMRVQSKTNAQIAELLGCAEPTVSSYRQGHTEMRINDAVKVAEFLGVSPVEALFQEFEIPVAQAA